MDTPTKRRNFCGQRIALAEGKQEQISEFNRMRRRDG